MNKKSILIVMSSLSAGGAEKSLIDFLYEVDFEKYQIDLLLLKKRGLFLNQLPEAVNLLETPQRISELYIDHIMLGKSGIVKIVGTFFAMLLKKGFDYQKAFRWKYFYRDYIETIEKEYDIAIGWINGESSYLVCDKVNAKKRILMVHSDYKSANFPREYDYEYFRQADYVGSISEKCVDILKEVFPEFSYKFWLLRNITSEKVVRRKGKEFYPCEYNGYELNILSIGRLSYEKGFDLAVEAAKFLLKFNVDFKWFVIGEGDERKKLHSLIQKNKLDKNFFLLGLRENPYPYIANCDVFVQPSRYEGKSVVLDEAKILYRPIIVTEYPTVHDQINENEGIIVAMKGKSIAEGIMSMYDLDSRKIYSDYMFGQKYGNQSEMKKYYEIFDM